MISWTVPRMRQRSRLCGFSTRMTEPRYLSSERCPATPRRAPTARPFSGRIGTTHHAPKNGLGWRRIRERQSAWRAPEGHAPDLQQRRITGIAAAVAAEIVSPVWACLGFPGFPSRNTSRLNRNLGIRNDRVSDARVPFGCRALLFRIRGSVLDVEQVSQSSCLRVSARGRIRQGNT